MSGCVLLLGGGCATEMQEPSDAQSLAMTGGAAGGGAGGTRAGESAQQGAGTSSGGGGTSSAGTAGAPDPSRGGTGGGGASGGGASGGGVGGVSAGGGGVGGAGKAGAGGIGGGAGGAGGSAGKGGMGGSGGTGAMPNPCEKVQLKITNATASSTENDTFPASKAFDGDAGTRWASAQSEPQWIYFDLGQVAHVSRVAITWETAFATNYRVEIAQAAAGPWTSLFQETNGDGAVDDLMTFTPRNGRFVRLYANTRATPYGFSVWEVAVYGDLDETCK